ncbi:hypothetical protein PpBr36_08947 [Pyricularia pennisetigena]|uniref:hypothetical protein n=1 Tax=Pyricularia pennisetigena TaxID=1578925 RepID=UPI0011517E57|nr:hypothetical protein PpBr36_08947 [Pyricularia pennisetigena]TLS24364.1 hypothetical protein PpBr36_08947 [Pyricularia pennisetigena]
MSRPISSLPFLFRHAPSVPARNDQAGNVLAELVDAGSTENLHDAHVLADVLEHPGAYLVAGERVDAEVRQAQAHVEGSTVAQLQHLAELGLEAGRHDLLNVGGRLRGLHLVLDALSVAGCLCRRDAPPGLLERVVREARVAVPVQRLRVVDAVPAQARRQVRDRGAGLLLGGFARRDGLEEHVVDVALRDGRVALALQAGVQIVLFAVQEPEAVNDANVEHRRRQAAPAPVGSQPVHVHVCGGVVGLSGMATDGGERRGHDEEVEIGRVEDGVEVAGPNRLGPHDALQRLDRQLSKDAVVEHHGAVDDAAHGRAGRREPRLEREHAGPVRHVELLHQHRAAHARPQLVAPHGLRVVGRAAAREHNVARALLRQQLAEGLAQVARDADQDVRLVRAEHACADHRGRRVRDVALGAPVDDLEGRRGRGAGAVQQLGDAGGGCSDGLVARGLDLQGFHVRKLDHVLQVAVAHLGDVVRHQELTARVALALAGDRGADQGRHRRRLVQEVVDRELTHPSKDLLDGCARLVAMDKSPARVAHGGLPIRSEDGDLVLRRREQLGDDVVQAHVGLHEDDAAVLGLVHARHDRQGPESPGGAGSRGDGRLWRVKEHLARSRLDHGRIAVAEQDHRASLAVERELPADAQVALVAADVERLRRAVEDLDRGVHQGIRLGQVASGSNARVKLDLVPSFASRCGGGGGGGSNRHDLDALLAGVDRRGDDPTRRVDAVDGRPVRQHTRDETPTLLDVDLGLVSPEHLAALARGELAVAEAAKGLGDDGTRAVEHLEVEKLEVEVGDLGEERSGETESGCVLRIEVARVERDPQHGGLGPHQGADALQTCRRHCRQDGRVEVREHNGCSAGGEVLMFGIFKGCSRDQPLTVGIETGLDVVQQRRGSVAAAAQQQKLGSELWRSRSFSEGEPEHILEGRLRLTNCDVKARDVLLISILGGIDEATLLENVRPIRWGDVGHGRFHGQTRATTEALSKRAERRIHKQEPGSGVHQGVHPLEESHRVSAGNSRHDNEIVLLPLLLLVVHVFGEDAVTNAMVSSLQDALLEARLDLAGHGEGGE